MTRHRVRCAHKVRGLACLLIALCLSADLPAATTPGATVQSPHFRLELPTAKRRLGEQILEIAESAREATLEQMPGPVDDQVALVWCPTEREFYRRLSRRGGHLLAAAVPSDMRIYLNGEQLRRLDRGELYQALVHEFVHICIGQAIGESIPLWLNEGLAMQVARQWSLGDAAALAADGLFGSLMPAEQLVRRFPTDPVAQQRAYRQAYSMTAFFLDQRYPHDGVRGLIADLAKPSEKSRLQSLLFNPRWMADFERRWRGQWLRPGRWFLILTGSGTFWLLVSLLAVYAYVRKRRQRKRREVQWVFEEEFGYQDDGFDD